MEDPMIQTMFNIGVSILTGLVGWILNQVHNQINDLKKCHEEFNVKVSALELTVARQYVHQDIAKVLFEKLDKIDSKLDGKVGREDCREFCRRP